MGEKIEVKKENIKDHSAFVTLDHCKLDHFFEKKGENLTFVGTFSIDGEVDIKRFKNALKYVRSFLPCCLKKSSKITPIDNQKSEYELGYLDEKSFNAKYLSRSTYYVKESDMPDLTMLDLTIYGIEKDPTDITKVSAMVKKLTERPYDIMNDPLFTFTLFKTSKNHYYFIFLTPRIWKEVECQTHNGGGLASHLYECISKAYQSWKVQRLNLISKFIDQDSLRNSIGIKGFSTPFFNGSMVSEIGKITPGNPDEKKEEEEKKVEEKKEEKKEEKNYYKISFSQLSPSISSENLFISEEEKEILSKERFLLHLFTIEDPSIIKSISQLLKQQFFSSRALSSVFEFLFFFFIFDSNVKSNNPITSAFLIEHQTSKKVAMMSFDKTMNLKKFVTANKYDEKNTFAFDKNEFKNLNLKVTKTRLFDEFELSSKTCSRFICPIQSSYYPIFSSAMEDSFDLNFLFHSNDFDFSKERKIRCGFEAKREIFDEKKLKHLEMKFSSFLRKVLSAPLKNLNDFEDPRSKLEKLSKEELIQVIEEKDLKIDLLTKSLKK